MEPSSLQPVRLEVVRACRFKAKVCALCEKPKSNRAHSPKRTATCPGKWPRGCAECGKNKGDRDHFGEPPSLNFFGTGNRTGQVFAGMKQSWQRILLDELTRSDLAAMPRCYVEGEVTFPDRRAERDQGNFRLVPEKALGDALVEGGWLIDDSWDRYEFGNLTYRIVPGESATRLTIFPLDPLPSQLELTA